MKDLKFLSVPCDHKIFDEILEVDGLTPNFYAYTQFDINVNKTLTFIRDYNSTEPLDIIYPNINGITNYAFSFQRTNLFKRLNSYSKQERDRIEKFALWLKKVMKGKTYSVNKIIGFCVIYKKSILKQTGYFNTKYEYGNFEDDDLHLRQYLRLTNIF